MSFGLDAKTLIEIDERLPHGLVGILTGFEKRGSTISRGEEWRKISG